MKCYTTVCFPSYQVVRGQGLEGHLLGLQLQAEEENIPMPELFRDTSFTKAFDYQISTSQVSDMK